MYKYIRNNYRSNLKKRSLYTRMLKTNKAIKGQSMLEVIMATGFISLIIITLVSVVTVSVRNATFAKNKSIANKYVNEGIEAARSIRDANWQTFYNNSSVSGNTLYLSSSSGQWVLSTTPTPPAPGYTRQVVLTRQGADAVKVTVTVTWNEGFGQASSKSEATFTKWKN